MIVFLQSYGVQNGQFGQLGTINAGYISRVSGDLVLLTNSSKKTELCHLERLILFRQNIYFDFIWRVRQLF